MSKLPSEVLSKILLSMAVFCALLLLWSDFRNFDEKRLQASAAFDALSVSRALTDGSSIANVSELAQEILPGISSNAPDAIDEESFLTEFAAQLAGRSVYGFPAQGLLTSDTCKYVAVPVDEAPRVREIYSENKSSVEYALFSVFPCSRMVHFPRSVLISSENNTILGFFFDRKVAELLNVFPDFFDECASNGRCADYPQYFPDGTPLNSLQLVNDFLDMRFSLNSEEVRFVGLDTLDFHLRIFSGTSSYQEISKDDMQDRFLSNFGVSEDFTILGTPIPTDFVPSGVVWATFVLSLLIAIDTSSRRIHPSDGKPRIGRVDTILRVGGFWFFIVAYVAILVFAPLILLDIYRPIIFDHVFNPLNSDFASANHAWGLGIIRENNFLNAPPALFVVSLFSLALCVYSFSRILETSLPFESRSKASSFVEDVPEVRDKSNDSQQ